MGALQTFVMGGFLVLAFSLMATELISVATDQGGYPDEDFVLTNQTEKYLNESKNFSREFLQSVQETENAPPESSIADEGLFAGTVIIKAITFTTKSLTFVLQMFASALSYATSILGIPGWVLALGVVVVVVTFAFALMGPLTRYPV